MCPFVVLFLSLPCRGNASPKFNHPCTYSYCFTSTRIPIRMCFLLMFKLHMNNLLSSLIIIFKMLNHIEACTSPFK